jgi:oligopeptide/dipeptide ABC transporter ATP-binding protein
MNSSGSLLEIKNIRKWFPVSGGLIRRTIGYVRAVDGISLSMTKGETLALVGESGSGKTTIGRMIINLLKPTTGEILYDGIVVSRLSKTKIRPLRRRMQMIFQDPFSSLNPRIRIGPMILEALEIHDLGKDRRGRYERVAELLDLVGLNRDHIDRFPHEFSGGQRQRIGIARALAVEPEFIVADEPVSALDVSVQAQIINLLLDLKLHFDLTLMIIAHDLAMVKYLADRVAVMYLGKIMEVADSESLFENPMHPYTKALISAVPVADPEIKRDRIIARGDVPSPIHPPSGCVFRTRCPYATGDCSERVPELQEISGNRKRACLHDDIL